MQTDKIVRQIVFDSQYFEIGIQRPERRNERFQERNTNYQVRFKNLPNDYQQLHDILFSCIDTLIKLTLSPNENSRTRLTIYHDDLETPIGFPFMKRDDITTEMIMARFLLVSQSNKDLKIENDLIISASTLDIISGGSNRLEEFVLRKDCIIKVKNTDNLCALRCIVIGIAHNNYLENPNLKNEYEYIIKRNKNKQTRETYILADALSIIINHKCSIHEIMKAEKYLEIYQILVISGEDFDFVYVGPNRDKKIVLFYHDDHYDYIKSLPAFFNKEKFCFVCLHPYQKDFFHA